MFNTLPPLLNPLKTGDLLPVGPLQEAISFFSDPSSLTFSAKAAILELKEGEHKIFTLCMMLGKVISFIYEKNYFGNRVPLRGLRVSRASVVRLREPPLKVFLTPSLMMEL